MNFEGTYTALITPFCDGNIDKSAYAALIERQVQAGITGIVPVGTTGESPTLNGEEHLEVIELAVKYAQNRLQVIAGTGANCTEEAIELTQAAEKMGVTGSLQVCPYYNKPSQEGLFQHFQKIAQSSALPLMLYSVPGRSGIEIATETAARLAQACPTIVSIKEAGGNVDRVNQLIQEVPEHFTVLSGDDPLTVPFMSCGAKGLISVASNLIPEVMVALVNACLKGDYKTAFSLQKQYYPLMRGLMSLDTNPVPIKSALILRGQAQPEFRLPLVPLSSTQENKLKQLLISYDLLAL